MNKLLTLLVFIISLLGCQNSMDELNNHINQLVINTNADSEKSLATNLQQYASTHKISYSIEVNSISAPVPLAELDKHMNKPLAVNISTDGSTQQWMPLDNQNIFILLRE